MAGYLDMLKSSAIYLKICAGFFIFLSIAQTSLAQKKDIVILKNGDRITGELEYLQVGILTFDTDNMEIIKIEWDEVKSISTINLYELELEDGRVYFGSIEPSYKEGMLTVKTPTDEIDLFMKYLVRINRIKESFWDILSGYIKFGFSFTKASQIGQLSFGGNAKYRTKINLSEITLNSVVTTTENEETSIKQDLTFNYQHNLRYKLFGGGLASLEENSELGIKLRTSLGAGIGNNFIQSGNKWFYALAGLMVNKEWKVDKTDPIYNIEGLINAQYQWYKYDHPKLNLLTYIYIFPSLSNLGRFRINYNGQLSWEVFLDFYLGLTFYLEYDNKPQSENASSFDYRLETSVKYEF